MMEVRVRESLGFKMASVWPPRREKKKRKKKLFAKEYSITSFWKCWKWKQGSFPNNLWDSWSTVKTSISFMKASRGLKNFLVKSIPLQPANCCLFSAVFSLTTIPHARFATGALGSLPHIKTGAQISLFRCSFPARDTHLWSSATSGMSPVLALLWTGWSLQGRDRIYLKLLCLCFFAHGDSL